LLSTFPNLDWIAPNLEIADLAARFRAVHRPPHTPGATALIANDAAFERVRSAETLILDQFL